MKRILRAAVLLILVGSSLAALGKGCGSGCESSPFGLLSEKLTYDHYSEALLVALPSTLDIREREFFRVIYEAPLLRHTPLLAQRLRPKHREVGSPSVGAAITPQL
jgi:hypothetical protein